MPKFIRKNLEGKKYVHVTVHSIAQEFIFEETKEKKEIQKLILQKQKDFNVFVIAYCIMNNHFHLLIKFEKPEDLSKYMHKVNTSYAIYYNKKHNRSGYVYKGRFYSQIIMDENHFMNAIIYIHNNPVKAKICKEANQYYFSSYYEFLKEERIDETLQMFGTIEQYKRRHKNIEENIEFKCKFERITEEQIRIIIKKYLENEKINLGELRTSKEKLKFLCRLLKDEYNVSYRQLEELTKVGRETIRRLLM